MPTMVVEHLTPQEATVIPATTTTRRRTSVMPVGLMAVVMAVIILECVDLITLPGADWGDIALALLGAVASTVALWFPLVGVALAAPPILASWLFDQGNVGVMPLLVTVVASTIKASPRAVAAVVAAYATLGAARYMRDIGVDWLLWNVAFLVIPVGVGLGVRWLVHRERCGRADVASAEEHVAQVRANERSALADELSTLVEDVLTTNDAAIARAGVGSAAESASALRDVEESSRTALGHIRHLVATLRGREAQTEADHLLDLVEELEDQLVGHGHPVEVEVPATLGAAAVPAQAELTAFLRAATDDALAHARAGGTCTITLTSAPRHIAATMSFASEPTCSQPTPSHPSDDIEAIGGSVESLVEDGSWTTTAEVPRHTRDASASTVPLRDRWATLVPSAWARLALALLSIVAVVVSSSSALTRLQSGAEWHLDALWALTWASAGLALWSLPGSIVLTLTVLAASLATVPYTNETQPAAWAAIILAAAATARRPKLLLAISGAWMVYSLIWVGGFTPEAAAGTLFAAPLLGGIIGLAAHSFITTRATQVQRLRELDDAAATGREGERRQLAGELHDIVAHQLSLMAMHLGANREADPHRLLDTLDRVASLNASARADLRTLVQLMRADRATGPTEPAASGWATPTQAAEAVTATLREAGHDVELTVAPGVDDAGRTTQRTISRVLREATTNILRYAEPASPCTITVESDDDTLTVDLVSRLPRAHRASPDSTGWGLLGLRERAALTGGTFTAGEDGATWRVHAVMSRYPSPETVAAATRAA